MSKSLDVIALGRSSIDLYGDQIGGALRDVQSFSKYIGGCPANIAVGTSRLGLKSGLITRVGAEQMGDFIRQTLEQEGIDTRGVSTDPDRLTALVILGVESRNSFPHIFYRSDCADMGLRPEHIDPDYIASAKALVITGTHFSTEEVKNATFQAIKYAQQAKTRIVLDIDYRPTLWGLINSASGESRYVASDRVTGVYQSIAPHVDLIVGTEEEIQIVGGSSNTIEALKGIRNLSDSPLVLKLGVDGCCVFDAEIPGSLKEATVYPAMRIKVFNTLGAGDAFMSGLLFGWLSNEDWDETCKYANACGAIVVSRHGCAPAMPSEEELKIFLEGSNDPQTTLGSSKLNHAHWVTTRKKRRQEVFALAFDHRSQLEALVDGHGKGREQIIRIKQLIATAAQECIEKHGAAVIIDDKYGADILPEFTSRNNWVARPVEKPGALPFEFEQEENFALHMHSWPGEHIAKCLVFHHPKADKETREYQERMIIALFKACRQTGHELLLEIIPPTELNCDDHTVAESMRSIYQLGVYPDWWKLPPNNSFSAWREIEFAIETYDKNCRGIVLLGLDASIDELRKSFNAVSSVGRCIGFAIGRSVFKKPAEQWVQEIISDNLFVTSVVENFENVLLAWKGRSISN